MSIDEDEPVEIPDTPATRKAQTALAAAAMDATAEEMDRLIRRTAMVTSPVRKAMVELEIQRRANKQEDQAQAGMTEQHQHPQNKALEAEMEPAEPETKVPESGSYEYEVAIYRQAREAVLERGLNPQDTEKWVTAIVEEEDRILAARRGETPEALLPPAEQKEPIPSKVEESEPKPTEVAQQFSGTPQARREAGRTSPHNRYTSRKRAPQIVTVLVIVAGIAAWFYHSHEVKRRAAEAVVSAAAAREQQARSIVARVRNSWNADDNWEDTFSSKGAYVTPYTIELENVLIKGRPIVAFGPVEDVRKSGEQDNSIVLIQNIGRTMKWDLRFSLLSAPAITKAILNDEDRQSNTFVIAATITSVEKVSMPPDEKDNDQDYFLAHGILHEAQPIGPFADPPHQ
ncbi:MAG: hypothetical protein ABR907_08840 [Terracidiphilus sp.]|jgi:hypothetical protein